MIILFLSIISLLCGKEYPMFDEYYYSQKGQDKFVNEVIFKNKKNGFFVEIGANDGISFSNTYYFEKNLNWSGICVEPYPDLFTKLKKNRNCYLENCCISDAVGIKNFLKCTGYITEMYSGLLDKYDERHLQRIDKEIAEYGGSKEILAVSTNRLDDILEKYKISTIDLISIDTEGGEFDILKSINFSKYKINVIIIENNFNEDSMRKFLVEKGFKLLKRLGKDDIFLNSEFIN